MAYVTLVFAMIGAISIALATLFFAHRFTKQWDEMASGCLVIPLQMVSFLLVGFAYIPEKTGKGNPHLTLWLSGGSPYNCTFCSSHAPMVRWACSALSFSLAR